MSARIAFREDPAKLAEHWCDVLPPGVGLIDSVTTAIRGMMRSPRLELRRDFVDLFPDCPALSLPRRLLSSETQALLSEMERREAIALAADPPRPGLFRGRIVTPDGDFRFFGFEGDGAIGDAFDPATWMEAFVRAMFDGAGERHKYEIGEVCRCALTNALALEPPPEMPPDAAAIEARLVAEIEAASARRSPGPAAAAVLPPRDAARRRVGARFLKPIPKPAAPLEARAAIDPFAAADVIERDLERARAIEKAYNKAWEMRRFARGLIDRIARWR